MWVLYALLLTVFIVIFDRNQVSDDLVNAARSSADYVHAFSYRTKPFNEKELKKARAYYETLLLIKFPTSLMHADLAFCLYYLGDHVQAVKQYQIAIAQDPGFYASYQDLGIVMLEQKEYRKAGALFRKALELIPSNKDQLIKILHITPKYQKQPVFDYYAQERLPFDKQMIYIHLLESLVNLKDYEHLTVYAAEGIREFPKDPQIYYYAALGTYQMGHMKESLGFSYAAIQLAPNYAQAYELKAKIMHVLGDLTSERLDMETSKNYSNKEGWYRFQDIEELHHWDEGTLLFQIYL